MSILDKVIAAVVPEPSDEARAETRAKARSLSGGSGWLAQVLDHHEEIEAAFAAVKDAPSPTARRAAQQRLAGLLTGHSLAEEVVLYPAMALGDHNAHSAQAYVEQSGAKVQTAGLEDLEPMSKDYLDKLEHLRSAVSMHMYREERLVPGAAQVRRGDRAGQAVTPVQGGVRALYEIGGQLALSFSLASRDRSGSAGRSASPTTRERSGRFFPAPGGVGETGALGTDDAESLPLGASMSHQRSTCATRTAPSR